MALLALLVALALLHVGIGARAIAPSTILGAIFHFDVRNFDHQTIVQLRLPRLAAAALAGSALGMAGCALQSLVRNPLAEPHILGFNAGAALAVVLSSTLTALLATAGLMMPLVAALGGGCLFSLVLSLASAGRMGPTPFKLIFCGVTLSSLAASLSAAILVLDEEKIQNLRFWLAGDLAGVHYALLLDACPAFFLGTLLALVFAPALDALACGDEKAIALGVSLGRTRIVALLAVSLLCGAAVSIAGPLGFVGLVAPHIVRLLLRCNLRLQLMLSALTGACLLIAADIAARKLVAPRELATGSLTALLGAPVFIWLTARRPR